MVLIWHTLNVGNLWYYTLLEAGICISNHIFGRMGLPQKSPEPNMWLLVNHTRPTNTLYWNYLLTAGNYKSMSGQLQNNTVNDEVSTKIDRLINTEITNKCSFLTNLVLRLFIIGDTSAQSFSDRWRIWLCSSYMLFNVKSPIRPQGLWELLCLTYTQ